MPQASMEDIVAVTIGRQDEPRHTFNKSYRANRPMLPTCQIIRLSHVPLLQKAGDALGREKCLEAHT